MECDSVLSLLVVASRRVSCRVVSCRVVLCGRVNGGGKIVGARHKIHITLRKINYGVSRGSAILLCRVIFARC